MNHNKRTGSRLFFIEFLIVLFFFLVVSTVCLKLFVYAHQTTQTAEALSRGKTVAASMAEVLEARIDRSFSSDDSIQEQLLLALQEIWPEGIVSDHTFSAAYDKEFFPCSPENSSYTVSVFLESWNPFDTTADNSVSCFSQDQKATFLITGPDNECIYELSVFFHVPASLREVFS